MLSIRRTVKSKQHYYTRNAMKNTKEMHALITAVYCINKTNGSEDKDITNLCRYIVLRCMNGNPNMMDILCIGKTKDEILPYLMQILEEETFYKKYMEAKNR